MALKDWKLISNFRYIKRWNNEKTHLGLVMALGSLTDWIVYNWKLPKKTFKTKSQALAFAKSYMR